MQTRIIGRQPQLRQFQEKLSQGHGLLGLYGLAGIGKTTLLMRMREICNKSQIGTVWIDSNRNAETLDLVGSLVEQLAKSTHINASRRLRALCDEYERRRAKLGEINLEGAEIGVVKVGAFAKTGDISIHTEIDAGAFFRRQQKDLVHWIIENLTNAIRRNGIRAAFFFDSLELLPNSVWQDVEFIVLSLSDTAPVVCASRRYDSRLTAQRLDELSKEEARKLLISLGVQDEFQDAIVSFTGIPRCLELSARYAKLPAASAVAFSSYDAARDDVSLVTDYVRNLILDRLKRLVEYEKLGKIRGVADLLEYGCILTELTPSLVACTLGTTEPFDRYLSDRKFLQELLGDGLLRAHLVDTSPPHFHDLIRELAVATLKHEDMSMYKAMNRKAAKYYAQRLAEQGDGANVGELIYGELCLDLTTAHLHDQAFAEWRRNFFKFYYHLSRANPQLSVKLAQQIFREVFFAHYQPFCEQVLRRIDTTDIMPRERAWLLTKSVAAGLKAPQETLEEVLLYDIAEVGQEVWIEAAIRLIHTCLTTGNPQRAQELLTKIERLGDEFVSQDEAAELYSDLASAYTKAAHYRFALQAVQKAVSFATDDRFRAEMNLQAVITLRRLKEYARASALGKQILPEWARLGEIDKLAETYIALGDVYRFAGDWSEAKDAYQQAVEKLETSSLNKETPETVREQGHRLSLLGTAYGALSRYYIKVRQLDRAIELLQNGLRILERGGNPYFHY
jgi:tetratricopeptide (TPR) repeat protein